MMIRGIIALRDRFTAEVEALRRPELLELLDETPVSLLTRMANAESYALVTAEDAAEDEEYLIVSENLVLLDDGEYGRMDASGQQIFCDANDVLCAVRMKGRALGEVLAEADEATPFERLERHFAEAFTEALEAERLEMVCGIRVLDFIDQSEALSELRENVAMRWMTCGVRIDDPKLTSIGMDVHIGAGAHLIGQVTLSGKTRIGEGAIVIDSRIIDSTLGAGVRVHHAFIESSVMEEGANMGPFAHLRPKAHLGRNVHLGNFVEVKNASLGEGSKAGHLAYIGDADIGSGVNVGCGVVFVNYDGKRKHRSVIGDGAFLGSNANIVAPVCIESEGYVAAGSTITTDVESGALAIERADQRNIAGYVEKRKAKGTL